MSTECASMICACQKRQSSTCMVGIMALRRVKVALLLVPFVTAALSIMTNRRTLLFDFIELRQVSTASEGRDGWWLYRGAPDDVHLRHPHMGARHPNGSYGMVVNPSVERLRDPIITQASILLNTSGNDFLCPTANNSYGIEGKGGNQVMHKIRRGFQQAPKLLRSRTTSPGDPVRILCMIYTVNTPKGNHSMQAAIAETWGRQCDGLIGASNWTDHEIGTISLLHEGSEEYSNMWQKIRSMWTYAYDHYVQDYDYFYIAGDDTYVLMDNMRLFLRSQQVERLKNGHLDRISRYYVDHGFNTTAHMRPRPLVFGTPMMYPDIPVFAGGGGYILNQAALKMWGELGVDYFKAEIRDSREDVFMGKFFFQHGVYISDTQDEEGRWRFDSSGEAMAAPSKGISHWIKPTLLQSQFGFPNHTDLDAGSQSHISFHLKYCKVRVERAGLTGQDLLLRYHAFFHSWCPNDEL